MSTSGHFGAIDHEKFAEAARRAHSEMDRRTLRTRTALHGALIKLIVQRGYDEITVADIADAADVGRSTFYVHYGDKDDLLRSGIGYLKTMLAHPPMPSDDNDPLRFSPFLTSHLKDQKTLYRAIMRGSAGPIVIGTMRQALCEVLRLELRTAKGKRPDELLVQFIVGAYLSVVTWWLDRGARESPEVIDRAFRQLADGALQNANS